MRCTYSIVYTVYLGHRTLLCHKRQHECGGPDSDKASHFQSHFTCDTISLILSNGRRDIEQSVLAPTCSCTDVLISTQNSDKRLTTVVRSHLILCAYYYSTRKNSSGPLKSNQDISATCHQVLSLLFDEQYLGSNLFLSRSRIGPAKGNRRS